MSQVVHLVSKSVPGKFLPLHTLFGSRETVGKRKHLYLEALVFLLWTLGINFIPFRFHLSNFGLCILLDTKQAMRLLYNTKSCSVRVIFFLPFYLQFVFLLFVFLLKMLSDDNKN